MYVYCQFHLCEAKKTCHTPVCALSVHFGKLSADIHSDWQLIVPVSGISLATEIAETIDFIFQCRFIYSRLRLIRPHQNTIFLYELTVVTN